MSSHRQRLKVIEVLPKGKVLCECECGNTKEYYHNNIITGRTKSCGCLRNERVKDTCTKHGMSKTPLYHTWIDIKSRCCNTKDSGYDNYGGRGITICDRWLHSFENFYEDMRDKPDKSYSIERVNVNGNYEPTNCVWASDATQARNQRKGKNNTSGVTGVRFQRSEGRYRAYITDPTTGKQRLKSFSIFKYGEGEALRLAKQWRLDSMQDLKDMGVIYGEYHGL